MYKFNVVFTPNIIFKFNSEAFKIIICIINVLIAVFFHLSVFIRVAI